MKRGDGMTTWLIRLRPEPDAVPETIRLRRAIKMMLRTFRLRCVRVCEENKTPIRESFADSISPRDAGQPGKD